MGKKRNRRSSAPSTVTYDALESRQLLSAYFPAYVDGSFSLGTDTTTSPYPLANTFDLESNPSATKTIYLDFDGHHSVSNSWGHNIVFPAYNFSGSSSTFSTSELIDIQEIFQNMAEDFLPFDVNVTTKDPGLEALRKTSGGDQEYGMRVIFTQPTGGFGNGIGGVAFLNSFNDSIDNPCFVFVKGDDNAAMAGSHEAGHTLGLSHDGLGGQSYHPGSGSDGSPTSWGPIMGAPYFKTMTQWSNGDYSGSTNTEDDVNIITSTANGFDFRVDDYGSTVGTASSLNLASTTDVDQWGIIERRTDTDVFEFTTGAGTVTLNILPFSDRVSPSSGETPNLDAEARLYDSSGTLLFTDSPTDGYEASFNVSLAEGTYYIEVDGVGLSGVYSDYGSLGFYQITGTIIEPPACTDSRIFVAPLNSGVAADDSATGTGYLMYSEQSVHTRFAGVNPNQADHLIAVRLDGSQWQFTTTDNVGWTNFTPVATDRLLADIDYSADTISSMIGTDTTIGGVGAGYLTGDLVFAANMWNGVSNTGEFGISGSFFDTTTGPGGTPIGPVNNGVAADDSATGTGYLMYSDQSVHTRFAGVNPNQADHLIAVRLDGSQWQYSTTDNVGWTNFTAVATDRLLADIDYSADTISSLVGTDTTIGGVGAGYLSGDLVFMANVWNGVTNTGEFGITGSYFDTTTVPSGTPIGPVNNGVAADDSATGTGYMMYSEQSVHTRFSGVNANQADHLIAVRLDGSQWQYSTTDNVGWTNFTPVATDRLLADIDYSADTISSLIGFDTTIGGVGAGYLSGDLVFSANVWNGVSNTGEFGVTGSYFDTAPPSGTPIGPVNSGIAADDSATGSGYLLYSEQSVHTRFSGVNPNQADHLIAVRLDGSQWQFSATDNAGWTNFTPAAGDRLLADINYSADTISSLIGLDTTIGGIGAGFYHSDLVFTANVWNGVTNTGEFGVTGSYFDTTC